MLKICINLIVVTMMSWTVVSHATPAKSEKKVTYTKGDLVVVRKGVNLRKGIGTSMPIIRVTKEEEVLIADDDKVIDGYLRMLDKEGRPVYVAVTYSTPAISR